MTISLEYIGAAERYFETASTGKSQSWRRGQTQDVSDTDAALLMATGLFAYGGADAQPESNIAPGFPVTATKTLTGEIEISGLEIAVDTRPVVLIGGDHPQAQWWGTDGTNGLAQMYADKGIIPYIAIGTHSLSGEGVGDAYQLTWDQLKSLGKKVELVSHGARHYQDWECPDAGLHVKYTGAAATATLYVTTTTIVGVTAGAVNDFTLSLATYPTLDALVAAIVATPGWTASRSPELTGLEESVNLLTIASGNAKSCKTADSRGARFSIAGGMRIYWDTNITAAQSVVIIITPTLLNIVRDGIRISSFTLASYTLETLLVAVKAANPAFVSVRYNGDAVTSINIEGTQAYCTGVEDASNLGRYLNGNVHYDALSAPAILTAGGVTPLYLRMRNLKAVKETAAANGVTLSCHVQSGGNFFQKAASTAGATFEHYRGNSRNGIPAPVGMPTHMAKDGFHTHVALNNNYNTTDYIDTLVDGVINSPGFVFDFLIHGVTTDATPINGTVPGSSGYYLDNTSVGTDIDEPSMVRLLSRLAAARAAGQIRVIRQRDLNRVATSAIPPRNLFVNSKVRARSTTNLKVTDNSGQVIPGWKLNGFTMQSVSAVDGGLEFVSNGSMATVLQQRLVLDAGGRYTAGARIESDSGQIAYAKIFIVPAQGDFPGQMAGAPLTYISSEAFSAKNSDLYFDFEVPGPTGAAKAKIISLTAQPYDLSTNKNIRLSLEGSSVFDIDCSAGAAIPAAVTAKEVAAAINLAISANAQFLAKSELHTVARAENGRVVLELARLQSSPYSSDPLVLTAGGTLSATNIIFGGSFGYGWTDHNGSTNLAGFPVDVRFVISAPAATKVRIIDPWIAKAGKI